MKNLKILILTMVVFSLSISGAIAQNYKSQFPVKVDASGVIKDKSGTTFGTISIDSIIKNHKGEKVAFIDKQGNLVNADGKILGKAAKNGDFHNINGEVEYTVKPTKGDQCEVYDKSGKVVAYVHNNYKAQAGCLAHCMQKDMLMK
ncbi:DUF3659 domain-containing protein [Cytophaga aurantiaca]|uniref:DUF3659 domain-containing protein n=1 Tax=Cytophaga aurantiaca TaxID=29530 RepID=UPI000368CFF8|nr:DUF3659 domain-containing protein [Cytophaga aurantiaca]